ncbi:MAG: hypothetical protein V8Q76_13030 [Bacteroides intestinalis]
MALTSMNSPNTPYYTSAGEKKAMVQQVRPESSNARLRSTRTLHFKATGSMKMYWSAADDPEYQRNKVNFRHYFICMPKKTDAGVVMRSGYEAVG